MNRCLKDCSCYCSGKPDAHVEEREIHYLDLGCRPCSQRTLVTMCRKDPKTCEFLTTQTQLNEKLGH
ncbi:hypothetical protein ES703_125246 [subsurface metagenome]